MWTRAGASIKIANYMGVCFIFKTHRFAVCECFSGTTWGESQKESTNIILPIMPFLIVFFDTNCGPFALIGNRQLNDGGLLNAPFRGSWVL